METKLQCNVSVMCERKYFNKLPHFARSLAKSFSIQNNSKNFHPYTYGVQALI